MPLHEGVYKRAYFLKNDVELLKSDLNPYSIMVLRSTKVG